MAATVYDDVSRQLILSFKHGRKIALAPMLAKLMAARLGPLADDAVLVPVPLHRLRLWGRGFNQSALLAHELSKLTGRVTIPDGLVRKKATPSLAGLGSKERHKALSGAIAINQRHAAKLRQVPVVLVDDVLTSGATTNACIRALQKAGVRSVQISCFARVVNGVNEGQGVSQKETPEVKRPRAPRDEL